MYIIWRLWDNRDILPATHLKRSISTIFTYHLFLYTTFALSFFFYLSSNLGPSTLISHPHLSAQAIPSYLYASPLISLAQRLLRSQLDLHVQWILLPYHENFLLLPSITFVHLLKVELPKKVGENESHFQVREIAAEAISRPNGEGVERGTRRA